MNFYFCLDLPRAEARIHEKKSNYLKSILEKHQNRSTINRRRAADLPNPNKCFGASRNNLCIERHPRHPAASLVILIIHINVLLYQDTMCALIDIQDIHLILIFHIIVLVHQGTTCASIYIELHQGLC